MSDYINKNKEIKHLYVVVGNDGHQLEVISKALVVINCYQFFRHFAQKNNRTRVVEENDGQVIIRAHLTVYFQALQMS